jgi:hypothetical protein
MVMKHFAHIVCLWILLPTLTANAQKQAFRLGLIGKLEFNRLKIENTTNQTDVVYEPGAHGAAGLYAAARISKRWFIDASVLLSRASYSPAFIRDNAEFMSADIRFTQMNLCLNMELNPGAQKVNFFVFGGLQMLYRRWGEENYINHVIDRSYWPVTRFMPQAGLGARCALGTSYLQPFIGLRYAAEQQLVYDTSMNQVFTGLVWCFGIKGKTRDRYSKCPTDF